MRKNTAGILAAAFGSWLVVDLCQGGIAWTPAFFTALCLFFREKYSKDPRADLLLFWGALAAYLSTFHWRGGDDIPTSLVPIALLRHGTFAIDSVIHPLLTGKTANFTVAFKGHVLSRYPVAASVLALPVYAIPILTHAPLSELFIHNLSKISASLITAASVWVFYRAARLRAPEKPASALALIYAFGTFSFSVSSQALWQHGAAQLGLAVGFLGFFGEGFLSEMLCGFGLGLAIAARPDTVFAALGIAFFLLLNAPKKIPAVALGGAVPSLLVLCYWLYYTGRPLPPEMGLQKSLFVPFQPRVFLALFLSPTQGLLWFSPAALFGFWAGLRKESRSAGPWILAGCLATWIFFSCYANWVGGMTFGPRYLSAVCVPLLLLCADSWRALSESSAARTLFSAAGAFSILVHSLGAYLRWPNSFSVDVEKKVVWRCMDHPLIRFLASDGPLEKIPLLIRLILMALLIAGAVFIQKFIAHSLEEPAAKIK